MRGAAVDGSGAVGAAVAGSGVGGASVDGSGAAVAAVAAAGAPVDAVAAVGDERGQALVEVVGGLPAMVLVGLVLLQLLATGYSAVLAGSAAEAGALALAADRDPREAVRRALPGWSRAGARVDVDGGTVRVRLRPPSPLKLVARRLEVAAEATVERP